MDNFTHIKNEADSLVPGKLEIVLLINPTGL